MVEAWWAPAKLFLGLHSRTDELLDSNRQMTRSFHLLRDFNKRRPTIEKVTKDEVIFSDAATLTLDQQKRQIILKDEQGTNYLRGLKFKVPVRQLDKKTYAIKMALNKQVIISHWRCGK
jgi:hypothetical protein